MMKIGLTGSIAVGKSFVLNIFKTRFKIPVFSSDACVKQIYAENSELKKFIKDEILERDAEFTNEDIADVVFKESDKLRKLEKFIHPLVKMRRDKFINQERKNESKFVVIEVPLLFEKKLENEFDGVILVDTTDEIQEKRVMLRKKMDKEKYLNIKSNQMPSSEKIRKSDYIINNHDEATTIESVKYIIDELNKKI